MTRPLYNFRLAPEAIWLVINTVLGTLIIEVLARLAGVDSPGQLGDVSTWLWGLAFSAVRTALGAILAAATGGAFLKPGETPETPTSG